MHTYTVTISNRRSKEGRGFVVHTNNIEAAIDAAYEYIKLIFENSILDWEIISIAKDPVSNNFTFFDEAA